jgi:hypothetical protein
MHIASSIEYALCETEPERSFSEDNVKTILPFLIDFKKEIMEKQKPLKTEIRNLIVGLRKDKK